MSVEYVVARQNATATYASISEQIATARAGAIASLASLHDDLCELAQLERNLEAAREIIAPNANADPETAEALNAYAAIVQLPSLKVWSSISDAMAIIRQRNVIPTRARYHGNLLTPIETIGELPQVFFSDRMAAFRGSPGTATPETALEDYVSLTTDIETARLGVMDALATLHDDLCALAALERDLEEQRLIIARDVGIRDIAEVFRQNSRIIEVPAQRVWSAVDNAMQVIAAHNSPGTTSAADDVPAIFRATNRFELFTKGE